VNEFRDDDEILTLLKEAFPPQHLKPDHEAREHLRNALANDIVVPLSPSRSRDARRRRRFGSHASALVLCTVGVLTLGGAAAAAVATNTLPGPTRAWAYDLDLPVTSPALYQAHQQLHELDSAIAHHRASVARQLGRGLVHDLTLLNHTDLSQIRAQAQKALTQSGLLQQASKVLQITTPSTTTTLSPSSSTSTTTSTTSTVLVPPTIPVVGPLPGTTGSTGVGGTLKKTISTVKSLLP
jgi:hypothetical protein